MGWWHDLRLRDWLLVAFILAFGVATALFVPVPGGWLRWIAPNHGFQREWRCTPQLEGDPVCVRRQ